MEIIDADRIRELFSMADCIAAMEIAMVAVSESNLAIPPRTIMPLVDKSGYLGVMPGSLGAPLVYGAQVVSLHPGNPAAGRPAIQGFVALFDHETGAPLALVDGAEITAMRTAAASGLATRLLARPEAATLGLFGCGVQAASHLEAIAAVRDISEVRVWGRSLAQARAFAETQAGRTEATIVAVDDAREAAACDIVCTVTGAAEPVLQGGWLRPGAHVNLVGAHSPTTREADSALIAGGRLYVDSRDAALVEAGDLLIPIAEGTVDPAHIRGEIGEILLGRLDGRTDDHEITVYKSLGLVAQDLVAAHAVYARGQRH